jgi:hypothetical protein
MSCIPGIEVKLYVDGNEVAIGGALRLETKSEPVDITTLADSARHFTPGKSCWKLQFSGVVATVDALMTQLITATLTRSFVIVRIQTAGKLFGGQACIAHLITGADNGKAVQIEALLQGAGEMEML